MSSGMGTGVQGREESENGEMREGTGKCKEAREGEK